MEDKSGNCDENMSRKENKWIFLIWNTYNNEFLLFVTQTKIVRSFPEDRGIVETPLEYHIVKYLLFILYFEIIGSKTKLDENVNFCCFIFFFLICKQPIYKFKHFSWITCQIVYLLLNKKLFS